VRLRAELASARLEAATSTSRLKEVETSRLEAEQLAADAVRSASAASRAAEELRGQLVAVRRQTGVSEQTSDGREAALRHMRAEHEALRAELASKNIELQTVRSDLAHTKTIANRREIEYASREAEMQTVRSRALTIVSAMRRATGSLDSQTHAHAALESHFSALEASIAYP